MSKTATEISRRDRVTVSQGLYLMDPPHEGYQYVILSKALSVPETYIFPSSKSFSRKDWGELKGSRKGIYSDEEILKGIGYSKQ